MSPATPGPGPALPTGTTLRNGTEDDLPAIGAIYDHYILNTTTTFYTTPRTLPELRAWAGQFAPGSGREWLVVETVEGIVGFACSAMFNARQAYASSVMSSIYLAPGRTGRGLGGPLYGSLLERVDAAGIHRTFAWITQPNEASVALHGRCGFAAIGTMSQAGRKFDRYWDVLMMQRPGPDDLTTG